jgi:hypothetical protein
MTDELRSCPFCGSTSLPHIYKVRNLGYDHPGFVKCSNCVDGVSAATWNTRPIEDVLRAKIAELEAEVAKLKKNLKEFNSIYC